ACCNGYRQPNISVNAVAMATPASSRVAGFPSADARQRRVRIDGAAATGMDLEVQMRPGRVAGRAHLPDDLARGHVARGAHVLGQVVVDVAVPVVAGDVRAHAATAAVAKGEVAAHYRELGHAHRAVHINPGVKPTAARAE